MPLTEERQEGFLLALAAGLSVSTAVALAGVSRRTLYEHRRRDEEFAEQWDDALELSLGQIEGRLETIAIQGEMGSIATVRAAEALLRARQRPLRTGRDSFRVKNAEGQTRIIIWDANDGLTPD